MISVGNIFYSSVLALVIREIPKEKKNISKLYGNFQCARPTIFQSDRKKLTTRAVPRKRLRLQIIGEEEEITFPAVKVGLHGKASL